MLAPQEFMRQEPLKKRQLNGKSVKSRTEAKPDRVVAAAVARLHPVYRSLEARNTIDGDAVEGPFNEEFAAELRAQYDQYKADKAKGINRGIPLEQVMRELGLDNHN
ncbi:MAG: hypothetical protein QM537_02545 [Candidatus Symbiobacter sp.]|nr:hypothetical protein [Candidatus Symbiobacter sp.]MDI9348863.1 hypothetical protein [Candidatus Symbiobacter sp.]